MAEALSTHNYNNSSYVLLTKTTWQDAQAQAQAMGGNLVTINGAGEEQWLQQTFGTKAFWTGLTDQAQEGNWQWISGEPVAYTNWLTGKPDNKGGNEDFAVMNGGTKDQWNDKDGALLKQAIVEIKATNTDNVNNTDTSNNTTTAFQPVPVISSDTKLKFNFTYEGDGQGSSKVSQQQMIAFEMAGRIWSQYLEDDVVLNIHIDVDDDLPDGVIGGAVPGFVDEKYADVRSSLTKDASSNHDNAAVSNLPSILDTTVILRDQDSTLGDSSFWVSNDFLSPTRANAKAIGTSQVSSNTTNFDGYILMSDLTNTPYRWHYDQYDASGQPIDLLESDELDFLSVAVHELGHILGFVSGVDYQQSDWTRLYAELDQLATDNIVQLSDIASFVQGVLDAINDIVGERANVTSTLDLFRYAPLISQPVGNDLSLGGNPFFSITDGADMDNPLMKFANGRLSDALLAQRIGGGLDNYQGSHWELGSNGIMVPAITPGQRNAISDLELMAFDVMGYNRTSGFSLPNYANLYQTAQATVAQYSLPRTTQSGLDAVLAMIDASSMYEGRGSRRTRRRQEVLDVFAQEALFSNFDMDEWQAYLESVELDESGTAGKDVMEGSIGDDCLWGMGNADKLLGYEGDDKLHGNRGDDVLLGGDGDDTLIGGLGDDVLKGEAGNDLLRGGAGRDVLTGVDGADTFVIEDKLGFDVIRDFTVGEDKLLLANDLQITLGQRNDHTIISLAGDATNLLAVLRNVDATTLSIEANGNA